MPRRGSHRPVSLWFFDPALLEARKPRARRQAPVEVPCARCGALVERHACDVRKAAEAAAAARREPQFFCSECWSDRRAFPVRYVIGHGPTGASPAVSAAVSLQWATGKRDKTVAGERMRQTVEGLRKSTTRFPAWVEARTQSHWGHGLSEERKAELASRALRHAQRESDRSREAREREEQMRKSWAAGKTVQQIADELHTTTNNVKQMRLRLGLPTRPRGRPREK